MVVKTIRALDRLTVAVMREIEVFAAAGASLAVVGRGFSGFGSFDHRHGFSPFCENVLGSGITEKNKKRLHGIGREATARRQRVQQSVNGQPGRTDNCLSCPIPWNQPSLAAVRSDRSCHKLF